VTPARNVLPARFGDTTVSHVFVPTSNVVVALVADGLITTVPSGTSIV